MEIRLSSLGPCDVAAAAMPAVIRTHAAKIVCLFCLVCPKSSGIGDYRWLKYIVLIICCATVAL